ncbi:MAG TPA: glutathione S-transferase [Paracoccaceae bacterium]|nr:glutathione S-transferase [Paracoccaceae bacterium]
MATRLHGFGESGNAYKAALALDLMGLPWNCVFVPFFAGGTRTPAFRALNPMGEVPVLEHDGRVLTQSAVILRHPARLAGRFAGTDGEEVLRWLLWDNHRLSGMIGPRRFIANFLPEDKRPPGAVEYLDGRLATAYRILDTHLAGRDWIEGDAPSIADLSCCGYLYYPEPFGFDRAAWPHIDAWLDRIAALPGWKHPYDLMPRAFAAQGGQT